MKVYIAFNEIDYEGDEVIGVYSSHTRAKEAIDFWLEHNGYRCSDGTRIEERIVDE
jgi:hypothetical protein